jgi:hypothetical protein
MHRDTTAAVRMEYEATQHGGFFVISWRDSPDGLAFRLYVHKGKFKVSYGYKLPGEN